MPEPDLTALRNAVHLRDRCRNAAVGDGDRLGIPLSPVQANVAYDAMADLISSHAATAALRDMAGLIDSGPTFPLPPSVISALIRERANDLDPTTQEGPHR